MQPHLEGHSPASDKYDYTTGHGGAGGDLVPPLDSPAEALTRQEVANLGPETTNGREFSLITRKLLAANALPDDQKQIVADILGVPVPELAHYAGTAYRNRDEVVELRQENSELRESGLIDSKSGCYSEDAFFQIFEEFCGRAVMQNAPLIMMYVDMKDLGLVNNTSPRRHDTGDEYIRHTGELMRQFFHSKAKFIRVGGDEFVGIGVLEQPGIAEGYEDPEHTEGVYTEVESAFRQFVNDGIAGNAILNRDLPPDRRQRAGMKNPGVSVGGVFMLPEDLLEVAQEIVLEERDVEAIAKRIRLVTDTLMYNDKENTPAPELGHRFHYDDLYTRTSRFVLREK